MCLIIERGDAMAKLNVRTLAEAKGWNISQLQKESKVTMPTARRYWYGTKDGKSSGDPLQVVDLHVLTSIAEALGVGLHDVIEDTDNTDRGAPRLAA
jgi:hypothetical protein